MGTPRASPGGREPTTTMNENELKKMVNEVETELNEARREWCFNARHVIPLGGPCRSIINLQRAACLIQIPQS